MRLIKKYLTGNKTLQVDSILSSYNEPVITHLLSVGTFGDPEYAPEEPDYNDEDWFEKFFGPYLTLRFLGNYDNINISNTDYLYFPQFKYLPADWNLSNYLKSEPSYEDVYNERLWRNSDKNSDIARQIMYRSENIQTDDKSYDIINSHPEYQVVWDPSHEVTLTTGRWNTGKTTTDILDAIYNSAMLYSQETGENFEEALKDMLMLAASESNIGAARHDLNRNNNEIVSFTDMMSNWGLIWGIRNSNSVYEKFYKLRQKYLEGKPLTREEILFMSNIVNDMQKEEDSVRDIKENPLINALKRYRRGAYAGYDEARNAKYKRYIDSNRELIYADPAIVKWRKSKGL